MVLWSAKRLVGAARAAGASRRRVRLKADQREQKKKRERDTEKKNKEIRGAVQTTKNILDIRNL